MVYRPLLICGRYNRNEIIQAKVFGMSNQFYLFFEHHIFGHNFAELCFFNELSSEELWPNKK
jgi:hypothetical protein